MLTDEERMIQESARKIAREQVAPRAAEIDETDAYPWDLVRVFAQQNWLGLAVPEVYGGVGASKLAFCLVTEELAKVSLASCGIVTGQELGLTPLLIGGNDAQKQRYLPGIAAGEQIIAFGLTEPGSGSDSGAMKSIATSRPGGYQLTGNKCFISSGDVAQLFSIFAKTDPHASGTRGVSALLLHGDAPGFSRGPNERKMGLHGLGTTQLFFDDCPIGDEDLLGEPGDGFKIAMKTLDRTRISSAAMGVGLAQGALDYAVDYAKRRVQFGQPIASFQGLQFLIADRVIEVEAARQLCYQAARLADAQSPDLTQMGAMAKCFAADVAMRTTVDAVQVLGGYGYMRDQPVERMMRDAKILQIWEGTNQIQRSIIARALFR